MEKYFQDFLNLLEIVHTDISKAVAGLPQDAIDWMPGPELNSIGILLAHIAGAERFWLVDIVKDEQSERIRATEFETHGIQVEALLSGLNTNLESIRQVLQDLRLEDLVVQRKSPRDGRIFTIGWCLLHGLEHTALHTAHIQITRQFWELSQKSSA